MDDIEIGPLEIMMAMRSLGLRRDGDYWTEATSLARRIVRAMWDDAELGEIFGDPERVGFAIIVFATGLQMGALLASGRSLRATRGDGTGPDAAW